jgi:hypothetical protein
MRPMTWFVSAVAVVGLVVLTVILFRFVWRSPNELAAETEIRPEPERLPPADAAASRPAPRPAPRASLGRGRPVPRFEPSVLGLPTLGNMPRATAQDMERVRNIAKEEGALFKEMGSDKVYVAIRGTKFLVTSREEISALGYSADRMNEVPAGALEAVRDRPPDGTLMRERTGPRVFVYEGGQKRWVTNPQVFTRQGYNWKDIKLVPNGSLSDYPDGSPVK